MARLTNNTGELLGGLDTSYARLVRLQVPPDQTKTASLLVPLFPLPLPSEDEAGQELPAFDCSYGSASYLTYSFGPASGSTSNPSSLSRLANLIRNCGKSIAEPDDRHFCVSCSRFYCSDHAEAAAHECASMTRRK